MATPEQNKNLHQAFLDKRLSLEETEQYLAGLKSGEFELPPDILAGGNVLKAFREGQMTSEEKIQFRAEVESGDIILPPGETLEPEEKGFFGSLIEMITGSGRTTEETQSLESFRTLPEKTQFTWEAFKASLATLTTAPEETAQILKATFPDIGVRQDDKGNFIFKSAIDGNEYAIKPGLEFADIATALPSLAVFLTAAAATNGAAIPLMLSAAGVETGVQAQQAAAGGEFGVTEIAFAAGGEGAGVALSKLASASIKAIKGTLSKEIGEEISTDLAELVRKAAKGDKKAIKQLAEEGAADLKVLAAMERLGLDLTAGQTATSQQFKQIFAAVESTTGSVTGQAKRDVGEQLSQKAVDIIDELGGIPDPALMGVNLKRGMKDIGSKLNDGSDKFFDEVNKTIPAKTPAPAKNLIEMLEKRADELGGKGNLDALETKLLKQLSPKEGVEPTYALLDDIRKKLTAARVKSKGEFKDLSSAEIRRLEKALLEDQRVVAKSAGVLKQFDDARNLVRMRKALEKDIEKIFGKEIESSIVGDLTQGIKNINSGKFAKLINNIPEDLRQEVVASSLNTAFGKNAINGGLNPNIYAKWFSSLMKNKQARNAVFSNLPQGSQKRLFDLFRVSDAIRKSSREFLTTGKLGEITGRIEGGGRLLDKIWTIAKRGVIGGGIEIVSAGVGASTGGYALAGFIGSAITKGRAKQSIIVAADQLMASREFLNLVRNPSQRTAGIAARSKAFKRFFKEAGKPAELSNGARWLLSAYQVAKPQITTGVAPKRREE